MRSKLLIYMSGVLSALITQTGFAGSLHYDAGVSSDYVWRGLTQTRGKPAVSGGIEFITEGNWYFGAWASNTQHEAYAYGSAELDLYVGMSGAGDSFGYDLGFISYQYPAYSGENFTEMYFALMSKGFTFKYSDSAEAGTYLEINLHYELSARRGSSLLVHVGNYDRAGASGYFDTGITYTIKELSLSLSKAGVDSAQDKDLKAFVSWKRSFD